MYVMSKARLIFSQVLEAVPLVAILLGWGLVAGVLGRYNEQWVSLTGGLIIF